MTRIYRISLRDSSAVCVPARTTTIRYASTYASARRVAQRMERKIASPTSCVIDVEIMTRVAGLGAAEWARIATYGTPHPGVWEEYWREVPIPGLREMEQNGDVYVSYFGPTSSEP